MNTYYVSLVNGLQGYYVKFVAESEDIVRQHLASYFGRMWCSVYSEAYFREVLRRRFPHDTRIVNRDRPIHLNNEAEQSLM